MAQKPVVWSNRAKKARLEILKYWVERNGTKTYSEKLLGMFRNAGLSIKIDPALGRPTIFGKIRKREVKSYAIFYEEKEDRIEILLVWDQRRNPQHLKEMLDRPGK